MTYAVGKALTQLTLTLAVILTVFLVGHFSQGVTLPWTTWTAVGAWLWLASMPLAILGILIGMTGSSAQVLGSLTYLVLAVLSGACSESLPGRCRISPSDCRRTILSSLGGICSKGGRPPRRTWRPWSVIRRE